MNKGLDERIKQRAYDIWQSEGCPEGKHEEHWHRAAAEIRGETAVGGEAPTPRRVRGRRREEAPAAAAAVPAEVPAASAPAPEPASAPKRARKTAAPDAAAPSAPSKGRQGKATGKTRSPALG